MKPIRVYLDSTSTTTQQVFLGNAWTWAGVIFLVSHYMRMYPTGVFRCSL